MAAQCFPLNLLLSSVLSLVRNQRVLSHYDKLSFPPLLPNTWRSLYVYWPTLSFVEVIIVFESADLFHYELVNTK